VKEKITRWMFNPVIANIKEISNLYEFRQDFQRFMDLQNNDSRFQLAWNERYPILNEKTSTTQFDFHYTYHPAWAARILAQTRPSLHIDISSTLHFCTMVSAFIPVEFYDYRPAELNLSGLKSKRGDLTHLPFADNRVESLSCMHVVEHIGLGRYGDPLDPDGDLKAIAELKRVLADNGTLLFVSPVGKPRIRFNAHRIYSYEQIASYFSEFHLEQFSLVNDAGIYIENADQTLSDKQNYGCGCWWFSKS
jgi:SAM-dependent methyltransferase